MVDVRPSAAQWWIDPDGALQAEPRRALVLHNRFGTGLPLQDRAAEDLEIVRLWRGDRGLRVRFRPARIGDKALTRLLYLLAEWPMRVALEYFIGGWRHELVGNGQDAVARVIALGDEAMRTEATGAVRFEAVEPATLRDRSPLHDLVENWSPRFGGRDFAPYLSRASERAEGRFVLFEHDRDRDAFLFRDFGAGIPEWAKYSLATFRGRALGDLHGDQFGTLCSLAYRDALERFSPTVQMVDANIRWPSFGIRRSCYWRLALPMVDPAGKFWLLSATLADAAIDLREAG
jgi:hypothetical protein